MSYSVWAMILLMSKPPVLVCEARKEVLHVSLALQPSQMLTELTGLRFSLRISLRCSSSCP